MNIANKIKIVLFICIFGMISNMFTVNAVADYKASQKGSKAELMKIDSKGEAFGKIYVKKRSGMVLFKPSKTGWYSFTISFARFKGKDNDYGNVSVVVIDKKNAKKITKVEDKYNLKELYYKKWNYIDRKVKDDVTYRPGTYKNGKTLCIGDKSYCKGQKLLFSEYYPSINLGRIKLKAGEYYVIYAVGSKEKFEYYLLIRPGKYKLKDDAEVY